MSISPRIAVLRGGSIHHADSVSSGYGVLSSLEMLPNMEVVDVYIDESGVWHNKGVVTDAHQVFSNIDGYIDTTHIKGGPYQSLADRMGIKKLFSKPSLDLYDDREDIYRLLRQGGLLVPESKLIRINKITPEFLMEVWKSLHPPYLVRAISYSVKLPSRKVESFEDFKEAAQFFSEANADFHVVPYRGGQTISLAALPNYRGEEVYVSIPVVSLVEGGEVPNSSTKIIVYRAAHELPEMKKIAHKVHECLNAGPILIDLIKTRRGLMIVEIKCKPSLRENGRFMESLRATGTELGHYLMTSFSIKK